MDNIYPKLFETMKNGLIDREKTYRFSKKDEWKDTLFIFILIFGAGLTLFGSLFLADYLTIVTRNCNCTWQFGQFPFNKVMLAIILPLGYLTLVGSIGAFLSHRNKYDLNHAKWWREPIELDFLNKVDTSKFSPREKNVFVLFLSSVSKPWAFHYVQKSMWPRPPWELFYDENNFVRVANDLYEEYQSKLIAERIAK